MSNEGLAVSSVDPKFAHLLMSNPTNETNLGSFEVNQSVEGSLASFPTNEVSSYQPAAVSGNNAEGGRSLCDLEEGFLAIGMAKNKGKGKGWKDRSGKRSNGKGKRQLPAGRKEEKKRQKGKSKMVAVEPSILALVGGAFLILLGLRFISANGMPSSSMSPAGVVGTTNSDLDSADYFMNGTPNQI